MSPPSAFPVAESSDLKRLIRCDGDPGSSRDRSLPPGVVEIRTLACRDRNPTEAVMADWLFIVSHTKPGTSAHMKLVTESKYVVILDRRKADRRRIHQRATPERRNGERRRRDVMTDLQKSGWALVRR